MPEPNDFIGLESRLRYAQADRSQTSDQMNQLKKDIENLKKKLHNFAPASAEIEKAMRERDIRIQDVKERMNSVEDTVFAEFCTQIGVTNIRHYEERELRLVL